MAKNEQERQRIGQRFAEERKKAGVTQAELAERCGLAQSHIARIEAGRYSVGFDTLEVMAEGLGKRIDIVGD